MENSCNHKDIACDSTCTCTCDICQVAFEKMWDEKVPSLDLCVTCGTPKDVAMESLKATEQFHFFQPCDACRDAVQATFAEKGLCSLCRTRLHGAKCPACTCVYRESCNCRECRNSRGEIWNVACLGVEGCRCPWC